MRIRNRAIAAAGVAAAAAVVSVHMAGARAASTVSCSPVFEKVSVSPTAVPGGANSTVTVTLSCPTPNPIAISLKGFSGVNVPAALHIPAGKASASGTIATSTTKTARSGWIVGTIGKYTHEAKLSVTVTPKTCTWPVLSSVSLPSIAYTTDRPVLTVKLSCAAASPVTVALKSSASGLPVPATVTVGMYYGSASVRLPAPAVNPQGFYSPKISATLHGKTITRAIGIYPGLAGISIELVNPEEINLRFNWAGPEQAFAPNESVTLKSSSPALTLPNTLNLSQPYGIDNIRTKTVSAPTKVTISATVVGSVTRTASITLTPLWPYGHTVTITGPLPTPVIAPQQYHTDYSIGVKLSAPLDPYGSALVGTATTDHPNDIRFVSAFSVAPGQDTGSLAFDVADETSPVHATITVSIAGVTKSIPVTIEPDVVSFTVQPGTVVGGQSLTGTVTLSGPVDVPVTVALRLFGDYPGGGSQVPAAAPASLTIPAGQSSVTFTITTSPVTTETSVGIDLGIGLVGWESGFNVTPPPPPPSPSPTTSPTS